MRNLTVTLVATQPLLKDRLRITAAKPQTLVMPIRDHSPFKWPTPPDAMWLLILVNLVVFYVRASHTVPGASIDVDPPVKAFSSSARHPRG
jgi:hypothetical protein